MTHHREGRNRYGETITEVRQKRLVVLLTSEELKVLDDFQFSNRIPTRAKAVRQMIAFVAKNGGHENA